MSVNKSIPWIKDHMLFLTLAGSRAYGTFTDKSDTDLRGIFVTPKEQEYDLFQSVDCIVNHPEFNANLQHIVFPGNPCLDTTVYSLRKFLKLLSDANPNIIELLFVNELSWCLPVCLPIHPSYYEDHKAFHILYEQRGMFLTSRVKHTFNGYAWAQFQKIERHRKWLLKGEIQKPNRAMYGLSETPVSALSEVQRLAQQTIEKWNFSDIPLTDVERNELRDRVWELTTELTGKHINEGNWPEQHEIAALNKIFTEYNISGQLVKFINAEVRYKNDLKEYNNWETWKANRNPDRMKLEEKYCMDTKHFSHLLRLQRMAIEMLQGEGCIVLRPDAQELVEIKNGKYTYAEATEMFKSNNQKIEDAYKATSLPREVNHKKVNELYCEVTEAFFK